MDTNKITFDKLDKKCIQQLPLMVDVISSTFNKIKSLYAPFYDEVKLIIKDELKQKKSWHLSPRDRGMIFYPFSKEEVTNISKLSTLSSYFCLWGELNIYSGSYSWNKRKASFWVNLVFEYEIDDNGKEILPYSYFEISNWDIKKFGTLSTEKFYSTLCKSATKNNIKPEFEYQTETDYFESIWIPCKVLDANEITLAYDTFRDKILIPFIRHLK